MNAIVVGATGLVGRELVRLLLNNKKYERVIIIARRRINIVHPRLDQHLINFDELNECPQQWFTGNDLYCTLGTTIKKAKTKENFMKVDYHYVIELAKLAQKYQCRKMLVITALGASERSVFFYSKVKGKTEEALKKLKLQQLIIVRPSLIVGQRYEFRLGEAISAKMSSWLSFIFRGKMLKYKPNSAKDIAAALIQLAHHIEDECKIVTADAIPYWSKLKSY